MFHKPSKQVYMDGGIYYNNPIQVADRERKLIWPNLQADEPDVIVSLGTGLNPDTKVSAEEKTSSPRSAIVSHAKWLVKIAADHVVASLDSGKNVGRVHKRESTIRGAEI